MARSPLAPAPTWPPDMAQLYRDAGYWQAETFAQFLPARAARFGPATAVVGQSARTGQWQRLTYSELHDAAERAAAALRSAGVQAGDRVVLQLPNCVEYPVYLFGLFRLGALPVFALPAHRHAEVGQFSLVADAAAHVIAGQDMGFDYAQMARRAADEVRQRGGIEPAIIDVQQIDLSQVHSQPMASTSDAESVAFLQLSGGTTGISKLIPRTHADYLYSVRESARICGVDAATVLLIALPAAHNFPMSSPGILGALHSGGAVVLAPDPSPATCLRLIEAEAATMTSLVPPLLLSWLAAARRGGHDLTSLRVVQVGGAKLPDSVSPQVEQVLGAQLQQVFGMAEGLVNYTRLDDPPHIVDTTQGRPISPHDEVRVVDDAEDDVPDGEVGMLLTRGPYTIRGYYRADRENAESFTADGFYRTGDLVRRLPSGHLIVSGRVKEQINRGGDKVSIAEVESHLLEHDGVHDAVLIGVPDEFLGERTVAIVVLADPGPSGPAPSAVLLRAHLRDAGLAPFKIPDRFEFVDAFPTSAVGKVSRRELRRQLSELASAKPTS